MKLSKLLHTPDNWVDQTDEVAEIELSPYDSEYLAVKSLLKGESLQYLKRITRVQNPFLYHRYILRKLEYNSLGIHFTEPQLVHATAESNVYSIIRDNLNWRLVKRNKFGKGVSFSSSAMYANTYCSSNSGVTRAMIIAKVIIGTQILGRYSMRVPPKGYDTSYGNGDRVFVKYYDDEFYPEYVVYYNDLLSIC